MSMSHPPRRGVRLTAAAAVLGASASVGVLAGTAGATPAPPPGIATTQVTAMHPADAHARSNGDSPVVARLVPGRAYRAECWTEGEPINVRGVTRRLWIRLRLDRGEPGYVNAIYLNGDEHAGVPTRC
jgi:hypothetical protein